MGCAGATDTASISAITAGKGRTGGSSNQPSPDDHTDEAGLLADRLTLLATSASTLSLVPSSVHATLVDPNWRCIMEEEFAALIANNNWDLVPRPVGYNIITDKWIFESCLEGVNRQSKLKLT
jgi:hypothetical protein